MALKYQVSDGSGIVVAECNDLSDAALIVARWGFNAEVRTNEGRRSRLLWREGREGTHPSGATLAGIEAVPERVPTMTVEIGRCDRCGQVDRLYGAICGSCGDDLWDEAKADLAIAMEERARFNETSELGRALDAIKDKP